MTSGQFMTKRCLGAGMGIAERKEREKKNRSKHIIDAAERVFFSKGFETATMMDVAKEAELSKGALYLYFHSKNELCMAILHRSLLTLKEYFKKLLDNTNKTGIEKFSQIANVFLKFSQDHPEHYRSLLSFREHRENCPTRGEILTNTIQENENVNKIITDIIKQGQKDKTIKKDIDGVKLSLTLWGNFTGIMPNGILVKDHEMEFDPEQIIRYHFELLVVAIKT